MRVNTKYINSIRSTSSKKRSETSGFSRRGSCVTQLVAIYTDLIFAGTSYPNAAAAAEGAALVMQATVVRSAVLTGTVHTTNVATRN